MNTTELVEKQRAFFQTGATLDVSFRLTYLRRLRRAIRLMESRINMALREDLGKSAAESYLCETGMTLAELSYQIQHVTGWTKDRRCPTKLVNFHAKSFTVQEPYGVTLIMAPWNYPFMLSMEPLVGALAAGNCCILKPSAYSPATSRVLRDLLAKVFPSGYVAVVEGGRAENTQLLDQTFDYIFFTGSVSVGQYVMEKAAAHLTPVSLELGGKSPCVVDASANLRLAAKRIAFGKYLNCGQTCVAPDYVLVDRRVKDVFLTHLKGQIAAMFGENPLRNEDYGKIINQKHFNRLCGLMDANPDKVVYGGRREQALGKIEPTVMDGVSQEDAIMGEEIFGPILPILTYQTMEEAEGFIQGRGKPLALYLFTQRKSVEERFLRHVSFGGGCINDTIIHLATSGMGFGGVGQSGMGAYHGKKSFQTFSHEKSIIRKYTWLDLPMRYQPYKKLYIDFVRMFMK